MSAWLALAASLALAQTETVGVQCSCDPPGTRRPPGFDCAAHCAPASSGSGSGGGSFEQQMVGDLLGSFMQGFMSGGSRGPSAEQRAEQARRDAHARERRLREKYAAEDRERRDRERARFQAEKAEAAARLKGGGDSVELGLKEGGGELGLKDDEPAPKPKGKTILPEALELLKKAEAADREAARALTEE